MNAGGETSYAAAGQSRDRKIYSTRQMMSDLVGQLRINFKGLLLSKDGASRKIRYVNPLMFKDQ